MKIENIMTCQEFLDTLQLPDSWESSISLLEFVNSPECGEYRLETKFIIVTIDGDEYIISDPENEDQKYPVSIEL